MPPPKTPRFVTSSTAGPPSADSPTPRPRARFTAPPPSSVQRRQVPTFVRTPASTTRAPKTTGEDSDDADEGPRPIPTVRQAHTPAPISRPSFKIRSDEDNTDIIADDKDSQSRAATTALTPAPAARPSFKPPAAEDEDMIADDENLQSPIRYIPRPPAPPAPPAFTTTFASGDIDIINDEDTQDSSPFTKRRRLSPSPMKSDSDEAPEFPSPTHPRFLVPTLPPAASERENALLEALRREPRVVQHLMPVDLTPTKRRGRKYLQGGMAERLAGWVMEAREMRGGRETVVEVVEERGGVVRGADGVGWVLVGAEEVEIGRRMKVRWPWWESVGFRVAVFWGFVEEGAGRG